MELDEDMFVAARARVRPQLVRRFGRQQPYHDAEDLADEVFAQAWASRQGYDPARGSVDAWLAGIASNVAASHRRRRAPRPSSLMSLGPVDAPSAEEVAIDAVVALQAATLVGLLLTELDPTDLQLIVAAALPFLEGAAIGTRPATPALTGNERVRLHRLRRGLARRLLPIRTSEPFRPGPSARLGGP
ncbi:MAG: putative polymerase ECF-subfamily sigma factor [Acidimicrobiales bacterium]|nr:putative polymerase ECF-subfamily sigma factor [Acidimicrobiales bacterium]